MTAHPTGPHPLTGAETFVIAKLGDGYRVYAPDRPSQIYFVSGSRENPLCTCAEFRSHPEGRASKCEHIDAAFGRNRDSQLVANGPADGSRYAPAVSTQPTKVDSTSAVEMVLKRSVSPDGRIDSLSIELSCEVALLTEGEIRERALRMIGLQQSIADGFNQSGNRAKPRGVTTANGAIAAQLVSVGGMDGKWGRRLFLVVQVQDRLLKFFGTQKQLTDALAGAGFGGIGQVSEGMVLNLPCRVATKPSPDGRYQNVEQIMPAGSS